LITLVKKTQTSLGLESQKLIFNGTAVCGEYLKSMKDSISIQDKAFLINTNEMKILTRTWFEEVSHWKKKITSISKKR
jgi:hypothetical protein